MEFDSKIISSCHINFLFGAGVNGGAFPQLDNFKETIGAIKGYIGGYPNLSFEDAFDKLDDKQKDEVRKLFIKEFNEHLDKLNINHESVTNLQNLLAKINEIVDKSENRNHSMKQINIFTVNYDDIVERLLKRLGYLYNSISATNFENHNQFFNMVGYDFIYRKFIPTFFVSKIHGDIKDPILPGLNKYDKALEANKFEILFKMKEKLLRPYSLLFVIGYSGRDEHINKILNDCVKGGLTIYWFKYSESDIVPDSFKNDVIIFNNDEHIDTTLLFTNKLREKDEQ